MAIRLDNAFLTALNIRDLLANQVPDTEVFPEVDAVYELGVEPDFLQSRTKPLINVTCIQIRYGEQDMGSYQEGESSLSLQVFCSAQAEQNLDASQVAMLNCQMLVSRVRQVLMSADNIHLLPNKLVASRKVEKVEFSHLPDAPTDVKVAVAEIDFSYSVEEKPLEGLTYPSLETIKTNLNGIIYENKY